MQIRNSVWENSSMAKGSFTQLCGWVNIWYGIIYSHLQFFAAVYQNTNDLLLSKKKMYIQYMYLRLCLTWFIAKVNLALSDVTCLGRSLLEITSQRMNGVLASSGWSNTYILSFFFLLFWVLFCFLQIWFLFFLSLLHYLQKISFKMRTVCSLRTTSYPLPI